MGLCALSLLLSLLLSDPSSWKHYPGRKTQKHSNLPCVVRGMEAGQQAPALQVVIFEYIILNYTLKQSLE